MAVLKQIKFGNDSNNIAKTVVTAASESVLTVGVPSGKTNGVDEDADYGYEIDLTLSNDGTLTKDNGALKVGTVPAEQVSVADEGGKFEATDVEAALAELKDDIADVISDGKTYSIVDETSTAQDLPTNVFKRYRLQETVGSTNTLVGTPIDILKDNSLLAAKLSTTDATWNGSAIVDGSGAEALVLVYKDANGTAQVIAINVSEFLKEAEFGDGLQVTNGVVSAKLGNGIEFGSEATGNKSLNVKIDATSDDAEGFLSVGANGVKISGVQDAIDTKVAALDFTADAAVEGKYVAAIEETDGVVAVKTRANVSEAVLNNYAKGSDATAVAATDTVNQAISKLENQVDAAKSAASAAHSVVAEDSGNTHVTVTASQPDPSTHAITYTIGETNIADADDLADEITRAQSAETAIDSAVGLTKAASGEGRTYSNTGEYIGKQATNTVTSDIKALDTQLKEVADGLAAVQYKVNGTTLEFYGMGVHA